MLTQRGAEPKPAPAASPAANVRKQIFLISY